MDKQPILLKDIVKDKTIQELIDLLPLKVCVENDETDASYWVTYDVIGFGKDTILLGYSVSYWNEDVGFGDGMVHVNAVTGLSIGKIPDNYIVVHEPTPKQKQFLEKYTDVSPYKVCGYQAHRIISDTIKRWQKEKEQRQRRLENPYDYADYDDFDYCPEIGINGF